MSDYDDRPRSRTLAGPRAACSASAQRHQRPRRRRPPWTGQDNGAAVPSTTGSACRLSNRSISRSSRQRATIERARVGCARIGLPRHPHVFRSRILVNPSTSASRIASSSSRPMPTASALRQRAPNRTESAGGHLARQIRRGTRGGGTIKTYAHIRALSIDRPKHLLPDDDAALTAAAATIRRATRSPDSPWRLCELESCEQEAYGRRRGNRKEAAGLPTKTACQPAAWATTRVTVIPSRAPANPPDRLASWPRSNWKRISLRRAPNALRSPISLTRSRTAISITAKMPHPRRQQAKVKRPRASTR